MGPSALSYASDIGAAKICQQGPKRGSEATERREGGFPPPTVGRFLKIRVWKQHFRALKCHYLGVDYIMKYSEHQPLPPLLNFFHGQTMGAWGLVPLSYDSDSGVARICQQGAKARERSDQAGELWEGGKGWEIFWKFVYENGIFLHMKCHY